MSKDGNNNNNSKLRCDLHDGSRSSSFLKFCRNFKTAMKAEFLKDDDFCLWEAMTGYDQGGVHGRPLPGGTALRPTQVKLVKRQAAAFAAIYMHIDDERLRDMLDAIDDPNQACQTMTHLGQAESKQYNYKCNYTRSTEKRERAKRERALV